MYVGKREKRTLSALQCFQQNSSEVIHLTPPTPLSTSPRVYSINLVLRLNT